jgi:hypothetical protein
VLLNGRPGETKATATRTSTAAKAVDAARLARGGDGTTVARSPYATPAAAHRSAIRRAALRPWLSATDDVSGESTSSSRASRTATAPAEATPPMSRAPAVAQRREVSAMRTTIAIPAATQPPRDDVRYRVAVRAGSGATASPRTAARASAAKYRRHGMANATRVASPFQ